MGSRITVFLEKKMSISSTLLGNSNETGHQSGVPIGSQNNAPLFNVLEAFERIDNRFPINELPQLLRDTVVEIAIQTQTMNPLVFTSVLGVLSLASQDCAEIQWVKGQRSPLSLFMISIAESGTRKTTVDSIVMKEINSFEAKAHEEYTNELLKYESIKTTWDIERKQIERLIKKNSMKGFDNKDNAELLVNLKKNMPQEPKNPRLIYSNSTIEAFIAGLANNWPSAGLFSDEGSNVINSRIFNQVSALNDLWSGSDVVVDRRGEGSLRLRDARCTISLMVQPNEFYKLIQKKGNDLKSIGFLARCLICQPNSPQGHRITDISKPSWIYLEHFYSRVSEIMQSTKNNKTQLGLLKISFDAELILITEINKIEEYMRPGGVFFYHKEYASKIADNIVRLAGIFHLFERYDQRVEVSQLNMQRAISVIYYYVNEYLAIFQPQQNAPEADARKLMIWICQLAFKSQNLIFEKSYVSRYAPNALRDKVRLSTAIQVLQNWHWIYILKIKNKTIIQIDYYAYWSQINTPISSF